MKVNKNIFRGYDLRGVVGKDLSEELFENLGKAHGTYLKRQGIGKALVGRDCRATSKVYSEALIKGLTWCGLDVIDIGMTLVGTFYWAQYHLKCKGGAFITASHNPAEYNGVKFAIGFSETLVSEGIRTLRRMVEEEDYEKGRKPGKLEQKDVLDAYVEDLRRRVKIGKFRIVLDPSNSTAGAIVPRVLRSFGCEVIECNCDIKPDFPLGTPDPTEVGLAKRLAKEVLDAKADLGFSFDSDGDRIGIADDKGHIIWDDILLCLFAIAVLHKHPKARIMFNTLCSKMVAETIIKYGGVPFMWRTGHSFLKKKNQEIKAAFIGELSGHFFFSADFYNHDDGIYSALRLLEYLSDSRQSLSEAFEKLPKYLPSPEIKLGCSDDLKVSLIGKIAARLRKEFPKAEIIDDERAGDGIRLDTKDSMFVIRYSQNGPYIVIKFEARTEKRFAELKKYIHDLLLSYEELDWKAGSNVESLG